MTRPRLERIDIEGYLSIRRAQVELRGLNVLVGANGAGKSNLISALALLGRIIDGELGLFVGLSGGASSLLYQGPKRTTAIHLGVRVDSSGYQAALIRAAGDELVFGEERLTPSLRSFGSGHRESRLAEVREPGGPITEVLRGCRVYHFHDTSRTAPVKQTGFASDNVALHPDAGNLAAVLLRISTEEPGVYRRVVQTIRQAAPFFRDFVLVEENERLRLRWQQGGSDVVFPADALSDGTLRFICLTTLLSLPDLPHLVVLDEPELGLHPYAIVQLAEMLRAASRESQVLIATQSVTLMNQFGLDDLIVAERVDGASEFSRPDPERLRDWLADYSLGELWEKNLLGGRPQAERR